MSIDKQYLREVAKQATGAHERITQYLQTTPSISLCIMMFRSEGVK